MHIFSSLKNFLYDNNDFIAYFNNLIYIYNFINIIKLSSNEIIIKFNDKKVVIKGKDLKVTKCLRNEIIINGILESVNIYDK